MDNENNGHIVLKRAIIIHGKYSFNVLGCGWQDGNGYQLSLCLVLDEIANNISWLIFSLKIRFISPHW